MLPRGVGLELELIPGERVNQTGECRGCQAVGEERLGGKEEEDRRCTGQRDRAEWKKTGGARGGEIGRNGRRQAVHGAEEYGR